MFDLYFLELMDWFDWLMVILIFVGLCCVFSLNRAKRWWKVVMAALVTAVIVFGVIITPKQLKLNKEYQELTEMEQRELANDTVFPILVNDSIE